MFDPSPLAFDVLPVALAALTATALLVFIPRAWLSLRARSLTPAVARWLAYRVRALDGDARAMAGADEAPAPVVERRLQALAALRERLAERAPRSHAFAQYLRGGLSDLRFTDASRVPFPFALAMRDGFNVASVATETAGSRLCDLDGNWNLDVSGAYGVNLAGYEQYKKWLSAGLEQVRKVGPVLGPVHPLVADNIDMLRDLSGQDEVSFHASGTEAVMAAVRLARFNTGRRLVVCFAGAYHGWWDGVQPGLGSEREIGDCVTLKDLAPASLAWIRAHAGQIAAVLVNPVQAFHPNSPPPNDAVLLHSAARRTSPETSPYGSWLAGLRVTCSAVGVPLVFDEVFSGFRLGIGGAQRYFGVKADMVVYGKTVAGGMPVGVVCGRHALMRRFDPERPMRMAYVVGTFAAHPLTMGAMHEFLRWAVTPEAEAAVAALDQRTAAWVEATNAALRRAGLPLRVTALASIWTIEFTTPSRFNWLLQYYLRAEGVNLSWVGTGRCMFNLDFSDEDYIDMTDALLSAGLRMREDKWWLTEDEQPDRDRRIARATRRDLLAALLAPPRGLRDFYREVMRRKHDDHVASHSHGLNQFLHLVSSSVFILCYWMIFSDMVTAMWLGLGSLFVRQLGHALIEPPCHDKEQLLLGFDTRSKTRVVAIYLAIPLLQWFALEAPRSVHLATLAENVAGLWLAFTALVVFGHVARLARRHGLRNALVWLVKLVTDPLTDIFAYYPALTRFRGRA
ncbi:MAG: aminotransferase class III-fold pyridoxal phosphate-dependent enzyme [Gammaproteobacteria bacterium]